MPELILSGPCALGIAMNKGLRKQPLAKFDMGYVDYYSFPYDEVKDVKTKSYSRYINGKPGGGETLILSVSEKLHHLFLFEKWMLTLSSYPIVFDLVLCIDILNILLGKKE